MDATLSQEGHPVAFISQTLSKSKYHYQAME